MKHTMQGGVLLPDLTPGALDTSPKERTKGDSELGRAYSNGAMYKQVKVYKGAFCLGTTWEVVE